MNRSSCRTLLLLAIFATACGGPHRDTAVLEQYRLVIRSVQLAEVELDIWADEIEPVVAGLREREQMTDAIERLYSSAKPARDAVGAIRARVETALITERDLPATLALELERADDAVSAYRGPRNTIFEYANSVTLQGR